jgi:hypothetical protein
MARELMGGRVMVRGQFEGGSLRLASTVVFLALSSASVEAASWDRQRRDAEELIVAGRAGEAAEIVRAAFEQALEDFESSRNTRTFGQGLLLRARIAASEGRYEDAAWDVQAASFFDADALQTEFEAWGEAGRFLRDVLDDQANRGRQAATATTAGITGAELLSMGRSATPPRLRRVCMDYEIEIEHLIDRDGRVKAPARLAGRQIPADIWFVALENLRQQKFQPAASGGEYVAFRSSTSLRFSSTAQGCKR